jgi:hypothetical protein
MATILPEVRLLAALLLYPSFARLLIFATRTRSTLSQSLLFLVPHCLFWHHE